ncbi:hypothetical protein ACFX1Q_010433 [Malus domestica]
MGAICCLEKVGLPLHQGSSQNDGRRGQTFSEVLKKEEVGQVKIIEVQEGRFYRQKFKCALNVLRTSIKISTRRDFRDRRGELRNRRGQLKNQIGASFLKSWACSETTTNLLFQICPHLSHATSALDGFRDRRGKLRYRRGICFSRRISICHMQSQLCENHGQFVEALIPDIGKASAFPDMSASVTCSVSFAEITGSLSKCRFQILERHLLFQTC